MDFAAPGQINGIRARTSRPCRGSIPSYAALFQQSRRVRRQARPGARALRGLHERGGPWKKLRLDLAPTGQGDRRARREIHLVDRRKRLHADKARRGFGDAPMARLRSELQLPLVCSRRSTCKSRPRRSGYVDGASCGPRHDPIAVTARNSRRTDGGRPRAGAGTSSVAPPLRRSPDAAASSPARQAAEGHSRARDFASGPARAFEPPAFRRRLEAQAERSVVHARCGTVRPA
jgi:hypothetical protein